MRWWFAGLLLGGCVPGDPPVGANLGCSAGECACVVGFDDCDGVADNGCEINTNADSAHCGACGHDCLGGACVGGHCGSFPILFGLSGIDRVAATDDALYASDAMLGQILAMAPDGSDVTILASDQQRDNLSFIVDGGLAFGAGGQAVYWAAYTSVKPTGTALRSTMIGDGSIGTIATSDFIDVVVTDGQHVLWAGDQAPGVFVSTVDGAAISAHFSGGFVRAAALTPSGGAVWLAANPVNTRVYWGPSDGSAAVSLALAESPLEISGVVSVDESVAWTTNGAGGQLWRRSFAAGEEPTLVHQSEGAIHCLRRRGEFFYFTVSLPGPDVPLVELPLGGGVPREIARIPTAEGVDGFYANCAEIGPRAVYWTAVGRAYGAAL